MNPRYISLIGIIFLISLVCATTNPSSVLLTKNHTSQQIEFLDLTNNLTLSLSNSISNYAQLNFNTVNPTERWITISLKSGVPSGNYVGSIDYSGGSVPVAIYIEPNQTQQFTSDIIIFPTSKIVTVTQGSKKTQSILITVPATYPRTITIQAVDFNPGVDTITFDDLNLGQIPPGQSVSIPVIFDATDAQTGTYTTGLSIFATDSAGQIIMPNVQLTMQVTSSISPVTEETFNTPPSCSLSATTLNMNTTYSFTCSLTSNIDVVPEYSDYYSGKKVETTSNIFKYEFAPKKYGSTTFKAIFTYNSVPVFDAFEQELRITSAGSSFPGTNLRLVFTPNIDMVRSGEQVIIQVVDNKTGSLIVNPRLWVDAREANKSEDTFTINFLSDKDYQLRAKAEGYDDLVQTIRLNPKEIPIYISPSSGDTSTLFNINTTINASLKLNGGQIDNPYRGSLPLGENKIEANANGYLTTTLIINITGFLRITNPPSTFNKGEYILYVNRNISDYKVYYQKNINSERETINLGTSNPIEFEANKKGLYILEADGTQIASYELKGFNMSDKLLFMSYWGWLIVLILVFCIVLFVIYLNNKSQSSSPVERIGFSANPQ
jgi:hypothetical protein